jgi:hypothetical protein
VKKLVYLLPIVILTRHPLLMEMMRLDAPTGLATDALNNIYVVDRN